MEENAATIARLEEIKEALQRIAVALEEGNKIKSYNSAVNSAQETSIRRM